MKKNTSKNCSQYIIICLCTKFDLTWRTSDFGNKFVTPQSPSEKKEKNEQKEIEKIKIKNCNHHLKVYHCHCTKFQLIWRTLGFEIKFAQINLKEEKLKNKPKCSVNLEKFKFLDQICSQKTAWPKSWTNKRSNRNQNYRMYHCANFH